jgi:hypothetical protein
LDLRIAKPDQGRSGDLIWREKQITATLTSPPLSAAALSSGYSPQKSKVGAWEKETSESPNGMANATDTETDHGSDSLTR